MSKEQIEKPASQEEAEASTPGASKDLKDEKLAEETDNLLEEIDELLDEARGELTAEQWVQDFVQRGGE